MPAGCSQSLQRERPGLHTERSVHHRLLHLDPEGQVSSLIHTRKPLRAHTRGPRSSENYLQSHGKFDSAPEMQRCLRRDAWTYHSSQLGQLNDRVCEGCSLSFVSIIMHPSTTVSLKKKKKKRLLHAVDSLCMKHLGAHMCAGAAHIFREHNLPPASQARRAKNLRCALSSDTGWTTLPSHSCIFYNYLHISNVSLRAHYSVMSSVLLLARVQPSGVLVWKKPS